MDYKKEDELILGLEPLSRRRTLRLLSAAMATAPLSSWACSDDTTATQNGLGSGGTAAGSGGATTATGGATAEPTSAWASGGTAAMTALASYPNPFEADASAACTLTCTLTMGPCHDDQAPAREDISEGQAGLPMRFALRILDDNCEPITDADVDVWHCDAAGVYSSETADNPAFCTGDNAEALAARFFRGHQMTDQDGIAWFNTCFPGWYSGRAIHIHFTVRRSSRDGEEYLTSQVAFSEDLIADICTNHVDYGERGQPDTSNTSDSVFPSDNVADYLMETQRMTDGAMLAWKTVIIRSSLSDSVCAEGGGGGPNMGGPGGGAPPGF